MQRRQQTETGFEPRHRILGAIVLVALGFVFFSFVLNEQPQRLDREQKVATAAPDTRVVVIPIPKAKPVMAMQTRAVDNPLVPGYLKEKPEPASVKPIRKTTPKPVVAKAAHVKKVTAPAKRINKPRGKQWMVQVGTFSNPANARRLGAKLKNQKYRVVVKVVALKNGRAVRVRVGPFNNKQSAADARDRINKKNGIKGVVLAQR